MVAGAYTKSRNRPVVLKYAPSHAERPQGRGNREKGKGWQRSKSSIYDYGSEFYFSEERTHRHRRAQSSMSGRRTDKNSSFYDIECPAKQPRRRRASVEACMKSAPQDAIVTEPPVPIGLTEQKRFQTVKEIEDRDVLTPNKAIVGHTDINRDRNLQNPLVIDKEGPKARAYTPKYEALDAEPIFFPMEEPGPKRTYDPKYRFMEMLITTETFKERLKDRGEEDLKYATNDTQTWEFYSSWPIEADHEYLNEMRIELGKSEGPGSRIVPGRVFFNLKKPTTIDSIEVDIDKVLAKTTPDGLVSTKPAEPSELKILPNRRQRLIVPGDPNLPTNTVIDQTQPLPTDFDVIETINKRITLPAGTSAVKFDLYVPDNQIPTFTYVSTDGKTVVNNYFAEAAVRMGNTVERTGRVPIKVPALGPNMNTYTPTQNYDLVLLNRCFTNEDCFEYTVGYFKDEGGYERPKHVTAKVKRYVRCPKINLNDYVDVDLEEARNAGKSNDVLEDYKTYAKNQADLPKKEWEHSAYSVDNFINFTTPTVAVDDFECKYILEIDVGGDICTIEIIKCDSLISGFVNRNDISSKLRDNRFKVVKA